MSFRQHHGWLDRSWATPSLRLDLALLLGIGAILIFAGYGLRDPWPPDEPRFALIAKEMVESGQWLIPSRGGELYPDKPPVFFWLIAAFYYLLRNINLAFLLPSALAGLGTLALVYDLGRRLWDRDTAMRAGFLLLGSVQFVLQARTAQIDMLLTFWVWLAMYGLLRHFLVAPDWRWYFTAWAAMGFGVITKGVGFLPLFLFLPLIALWAGRKPRVLDGPRLAAYAGGVFFLLAAVAVWGLPMLLAVAHSSDPAFAAYRDNLLFEQTSRRYAEGLGHFNPPWYFITNVIPALWLPLSVMFFALARRWWRDFRARDERIVVLLGWAVLVVAFFSISPGKRGVYILPALPAVALCAAPHLRELLQIRWLSLALSGLVAVLGLSFLAGALAWPFVDISGNESLTLLAGSPVLPFLILGGVGCWLAWRSRLRGGWPDFAAFMAIAWLVYGLLLFPMLQPVRSPRDLMVRVATEVGSDTEIAIVGFREQFLLQSRNPLSHFGHNVDYGRQRELAGRWLADDKARWALGSEESLGNCFDLEDARPLGPRHGTRWYLVNSAQWNGRCPLADVARPVYEFKSRKE